MNFHEMPLDALQADLEARLAKHHEPMYAYAAKLANQNHKEQK